jgi:Cu(I)/Ag(I) efflux system membrane fusion protein
MRNFKPLLLSGLVIGGVLLGILIERHGLSRDDASDSMAPADPPHEHAHDTLQVQYVCPMHPEVVAQSPGTCPVCGMDLVEQQPAPQHEMVQTGLPGVSVSPAFIHNFGVRTAAVTRGPMALHIESIGRVSRMPQPRVTEVKPGLAGKLVALTEKTAGEDVRKGEQLFAIDSPEWRRLQQLYLDTLADEEDARRAPMEQRLQSLGMTATRLEQLRSSGQLEQTYTVEAPVDGTITDRSSATGETVEAQSSVVTLGGVNRVPVIVSAFEGQAPWIDRGQRVTVRVPTLPGTEFTGQVDRTDREINFSTRTVPVYIGFNTADPRIRYGMLVDVTIEAAARANVLRIPRDALIRTGSGDRVIVARGAGRFQPVAVVPGLEDGEFIEVLSGLEAGQQVVVSGQFLIDSESSLRTGLQRMDEEMDAR